MARDFFDDDLLTPRPGKTAGSAEAEDAERLAADDATARMAKQKEELTSQVAGALDEIERLKMRQSQLEKEKSDLQNLASKQETYERSKRDIIARLDQSVILLEKEEARATQAAELMAHVRERFKATVAELRAIDESAWPDADFAAELHKALVLVEEAQKDYTRGVARVQAAGWRGEAVEGSAAVPAFEAGERGGAARGFLFWLRAGVAFSLPLMIVLVVLFVLYLWLLGVL